MSANDRQPGGSHYKNKAIQPWDFIASNDLDFFQGNIIKYVVRWREKGGIEDLRKAQHYLEKYIEVEEGRERAEVEEDRGVVQDLSDHLRHVHDVNSAIASDLLGD